MNRRATRCSAPTEVLLMCLLTLGGGACAAGADPPATSRPAGSHPIADSVFDPNLHLRTRDVRIGMTGYGLSVFRGTRIERFNVEVISILRNSEQIDTDVILIRASGAGLEHTGPIAGMSGSPIYLQCEDGKTRLLGAFAFGWPGSKEPIAGVQPIETMLALDARPAPAGQTPARAGADDLRYNLLVAGAVPKLRTADATSLAGLLAPKSSLRPHMRLRHLAVPLGFSGLSTASAEHLGEAMGAMGFGPMLPLQAQPEAAPRPSDNDRIEPGSALVVPILTGDLNLVATGTCTTVIGDRVYGFGHPMFGEGRSNLPMAAGSVDAVIPTTEISFKLGSPGKTIGTLASDAVAGVAGSIGPIPALVPVSLEVKRPGGSGRTYHFQLARHPQVTAAALAAAAQSAVDFAGAAETRGATRWDIELAFSGGHRLHLHDITANASANPFVSTGFVAALASPLEAIITNPFAEVELATVRATVELLPAEEVDIATLVEISLPRTRYKPGETLVADLHLQLDRGARVVRRVELELPRDLEPGQYPLQVTESAAAIALAAEERPFDFEVRSVEDLFAAINATQSFSSDAVYLRLARPEQTRVAVGRQALPDLPRSRAVLLAESGRSDIKTFTTALSKRVTLPYVLTAGEAEAMITILPK